MNDRHHGDSVDPDRDNSAQSYSNDDRRDTYMPKVPLARVDTTSTNATADDRPGPGRVLDKLYQHSGRALERAIGVIVKRIKRPRDGTNAENENERVSTALVRVATVDTTSTNATADDLPGPGRALDKVYQLGGRKVEIAANIFADRIGFGPAAVERDVVLALKQLRMNAYEKRRADGYVLRTYTTGQATGLEKDIKRRFGKLIEYLQSSNPTTQLRALSALMQIKSQEPVLADALYKALGAREAVRSVHASIMSEHVQSWCLEAFDDGEQLGGLLAQSRRALFYVEENGLNRVAKTLFQLANVVTSPPYRPPGPVPITLAMQEISQFIRHPDLSFLAVEYLHGLCSTWLLYGMVKHHRDIRVEIWIELARRLLYILPQCFCHLHPRLRSQSPVERCQSCTARTHVRRIDIALHFVTPEQRKRWEYLVLNDRESEAELGRPILVDVDKLVFCFSTCANYVELEVVRDYVMVTPKPAAYLKNCLQETLSRHHGTTISTWTDASLGNLLTWVYRKLERLASSEYMSKKSQLTSIQTSGGFPCSECVDRKACKHWELKHSGPSIKVYMLTQEERIRRFHEMAS